MLSHLNKNFAAKLPVASRAGNSLLALLLLATVVGLGAQPARGGDREPSLRERLREALTPPPPPVEPEPAVQRCPAKDGLCYAVVLGATKCKVWRTMGRPLPPPYSYDGLSSEEYVDVDLCPKDLICEFYRSFGKGMPDGCPGAMKVVAPRPTPAPTPTPALEVAAPAPSTPTPTLFMEPDAPTTLKPSVPSVRTPITPKASVPSVRTPTTIEPSVPSVRTPTTLRPVPSGRTPNPASTITSREWGDQPPGGVRIDVESKPQTGERLDRNEVLKLLRKPGS